MGIISWLTGDNRSKEEGGLVMITLVPADEEELPPLPLSGQELIDFQAARIAAGVCPNCGIGKPTGNNATCGGCRAIEAQQT